MGAGACAFSRRIDHIGIALTTLLRSGWLGGQLRARRWGWILAIGTAVASVELIPHLLASSEAAELAAGQSTPLTDLHLALQAVVLPVLGLGFAGFALSAGRQVAHPAFVAGAMIGGLALAAVGPLLVITEDAAFAILFAPANLTWIFLLAVAWRLRRRVSVPAAERSLVEAA